MNNCTENDGTDSTLYGSAAGGQDRAASGVPNSGADGGSVSAASGAASSTPAGTPASTPASAPDNAFPLLDRFLGYFQAVRERSPLTIREYRYDLCLFFRWLVLRRKRVAAGTPLEAVPVAGVDIELIRSVTLTDLYDYMTWLSRERGLQPPTRARKVSSLRSFYHFLQTKDQLLKENVVDALELPKQVRRLPRYLNVEESRQLLGAAAAANYAFAERDYCILTFFLNCGIRLSELCGINLRSIRNEKMTVLGKGRKERTIYLNGACINALEAYLAVRPRTAKTDPEALFISRLGRRISPKTVQYLIKTYIRQAGLDPQRYSTHKLRHTAATLMYQHGQVDIRALQQILGHVSIATTEIYTHVDDRRLHQAVESNPLAAERPPKGHAAGRRAASQTEASAATAAEAPAVAAETPSVAAADGLKD